jgi:peroxiredoxin
LAQLRREYEKFQSRGAEILAVAHDSLENARAYFQENDLPFPGLVDSDHTVFDRYNVEIRALSLGQRPGVYVIDKNGITRFAHVGRQQWQIPANSQVLATLDQLNNDTPSDRTVQ